MKRVNSLIYLALGVTIIFIISCGSKEQKKETDVRFDKAKESIAKWIEDNPSDYPKYKSVEYGELTPRYERTDRTLQLNDLIAQEQANAVINQKKLDSLKALLESNKGLLMGYTILHKYQTTNLAGEVLNNECLFFLDSTFRVASILNPDSYDLLLDPKVIFRPDSIPQKKQ